MAYIELFRYPPPEDGNYDNLDCPHEFWQKLRELGERFGWNPQGTVQSNPILIEEENRWRAQTEETLRPDWREFLKMPRPSDREAQEHHFYERQKYLRYDLYFPREHGREVRSVTDADALAWAEALDLALGADHPPIVFKTPTQGVVLTESASPALNALAIEGLQRPFLKDFVAYLRRGGFDFAWSF